LARDLIEKLLEIDPEKRLSSKEALQHPWLLRNAKLSRVPLRDSADLLEKFQRGRRRLRASILGVLLVDALEEDEAYCGRDENPSSLKKDLAWGLSSSVEALSEKTDALLSTLHTFDKEWKGFITKSDLARVSEMLGTRMSESDLNEMLVGATGDPEKKPSSVKSISYDNVKMTISTLRSASYEPGEAIIREGNAAGHNVYLLLDGEVEVSCKNPLAGASAEDPSAFDEAEAFAEMFANEFNTKQPNPVTAIRPPISDDITLKRLQKGSFFGEIELVRPDGRFHPRIATYRCAETASLGKSNSSCKVLQLVANDFLNISNTYSSINRRLEKSARHHTQERLIKCVEAAKGSIKKRSFEPGEFIYKEGEVCDSFFILLDGQVEVLKQNGEVIVEELHAGDYFPLGVSGQTQDFKIITRHSSVRCTHPTVVVEIGGETFRSFLHSNQFLVSYYRDQVKAREQQRLDRLGRKA
jgi:CRP-like cAMP-binding protein